MALEVRRWLRRLVGRRAPATPIAEVRDGRAARVGGRVVSAAEVEAPMSGRACAFFYLEMYEWDNGGITPYFASVSDAPFELEDESGSRARIHSAEAVADLNGCALFKGHNLDRWGHFEVFANKHGLPLRSLDGLKVSVSWKEWLLQPGETIIVEGTATFAHEALGYRDTRGRLELHAPMRIVRC
jgi:hypothetical protein